MVPITIVWLIAGYFLFATDRSHVQKAYEYLFPDRALQRGPLRIPDHNSIFSRIVLWLRDTPEPGRENQKKAWSYIKDALRIIENPDDPLRPEMMAAACDAYALPVRNNEKLFRSHWLSDLHRWNLAPSGETPYVTEPSGYWKSKIPDALEALHLTVTAMNYAYRIDAEVHGIPERGRILIPEIAEILSRAACADSIGHFAWGDYSLFLETEAFRQMSAAREILKKEDRSGHEYPVAEDLLTLYQLRQHPDYILALKKYNSGAIPDPFQSTVCRGARFSPACHAPDESIAIVNKLIYFSDFSERHRYWLDLGRLFLLQWVRTGTESHLQNAKDYLTGAADAPASEPEARLLLSRTFLKERDYLSALKQAARLENVFSSRAAEDAEFRRTARLTLMGLGYFREADCYADLSMNVFGRRELCETFRLEQLVQIRTQSTSQ